MTYPRLFIDGYTALARDRNNAITLIPHPDRSEHQSIPIKSDSICSERFGDHIGFISLLAETDCYVAIGVNPVADREFSLLMAGERIYFGWSPQYQVAVIGED
jgi:hypothetical protein